MIIKPEPTPLTGSKALRRKIEKAATAAPVAGAAFKSMFDARSLKRHQRELQGTIDNLKNADGVLPLFSEVEIETQNRCNMICPFCPVNKNADIREHKEMSSELFNKIIGELSEMGYTGHLALHSNNEPFLDSRIEHFAEAARAALPGAFIYLSTNGTVLSLERFKAIIPHLDEIVIDNYNDKSEFIETIRIISEYCAQHPDIDRKTKIHMRKINEIKTTRGGQSPNNNKKETMRLPCILPYIQMIVRPDGKISLCCCDAYGKVTLGDLNGQSMKEVWYSSKYEEIRRILYDVNGREKLTLCKYCDKRSKDTHWGERDD